MKVLFVSSGKRGNNPGPIISAQGASLIGRGLTIIYFTVNRKGLKGYLIEGYRLRKFLREENIDIVHAHYGLTAIICLFARRSEKLIVSFMGSDLVGSNLADTRVTISSLILIKINSLFARWFYDHSIVKSRQMFHCLKTKKISLIPNGVDLNMFQPRNRLEVRDVLGFGYNEQIIIFVSKITRAEKNYELAQKAVNLIANSGIRLIPITDVSQNRLNYYYSAADLLLLTSYHEGSPNVIKEAMACNCPIVSTDVGDVKWVLGDTEGCYIASYDPLDLAEKIKFALEFSKFKNRTEGRNRIYKLGLDSDTIAGKIIEVYKRVLN